MQSLISQRFDIVVLSVTVSVTTIHQVSSYLSLLTNRDFFEHMRRCRKTASWTPVHLCSSPKMQHKGRNHTNIQKPHLHNYCNARYADDRHMVRHPKRALLAASLPPFSSKIVVIFAILRSISVRRICQI